MTNLCFVILHYQNITDTINCVESILKLNKTKNIKINIILVDNKSPNDSGLELKQKYEKDSNIDILLLDKNYGFSKANNIGYTKALEYNPDLVLVSNNDILINDNEFFNKIINLYNANGKKYAILCPDIVNIDGQHQNPLRKDYINLKKTYKNYLYKKLIYILLHIPYICKKVYKFELNRTNKWMNKYYNKSTIEYKDYFVPFGAFVIYTKKWIKTEKQAFPSDTFMYAEEDFLSLYCLKKKYKMLYCPEIVVNHLEGQSVKKSNNDEIKTMKFRLKNESLALKKYIKFYKKMNGCD